MPNNFAAWNGEVFAGKLLAKLDRLNVMNPLANKGYEGDIRGKGTTVTVRSIGDVQSRTYTGADITYDDLQPTSEQLVIDTAKYLALFVDDLDLANTDIAILDKYAERVAVKAAQEIDTLIIDTAVNGVHADNLVAGPVTLTKDNIVQYFIHARTLLGKANVPTTGRWAVVGPEHVGLVMQSDQFVLATDLGDKVIRTGSLNGLANSPGFVGQLVGFNVYETAAVTDGGGTAGTSHLIFGDQDFISYAGAINKTESARMERKFATYIRCLLLHGGKVFDENSHRGVVIAANPVAAPV